MRKVLAATVVAVWLSGSVLQAATWCPLGRSFDHRSGWRSFVIVALDVVRHVKNTVLFQSAEFCD